jgi:hypothetical protein
MTVPGSACAMSLKNLTTSESRLILVGAREQKISDIKGEKVQVFDAKE